MLPFHIAMLSVIRLKNVVLLNALAPKTKYNLSVVTALIGDSLFSLQAGRFFKLGKKV
jgi:hypothetical protein